MLLAGAVEDVADQAAGEDAVLDLRHRAQRTGQPQPLGDDLRQLHRGRRHQPHLLARLQVQVRQLAGAVVHAVADDLVENLLRQRGRLVDPVPLDELQGLLARRGDVVGIFRAGHAELDLLPQHPRQLTPAEKAAARQTRPEQEDGRALHQRVVHVEEGGGPDVLRDVRVRVTEAVDAARRVGRPVHRPETGEQLLHVDVVQLAQRGQGGGLAGRPLRLRVERLQHHGLQEMPHVALGGHELRQDVTGQRRTARSGIEHGVPSGPAGPT